MNYTEKNKMIDQLCGVGLMAGFIVLFFAIVDSGFTSFTYVLQMPTILRVIGGVFLLIAICLFMIAYRKENVRKAWYGIEFLVLAFVSVILPHSYVNFPAPFNRLQIYFPILFAIYYIAKATVIVVKAKKKKR